MGSLSLGAALITQLVLVLPARWDETSGEDTRVQHAQILDGLAPPDSVLVAGHLALHLRWVSNRDVIALGEEIHRRDGPPKPTRDPHRLIHDAIRPYADAKRPVYITFDGKRWLHDLAIQLHGSPEIAFNNLLPLIVPGAVIPHPGGDPKLLLQLLRPPP